MVVAKPEFHELLERISGSDIRGAALEELPVDTAHSK
jgi:hypothetical protein